MIPANLLLTSASFTPSLSEPSARSFFRVSSSLSCTLSWLYSCSSLPSTSPLDLAFSQSRFTLDILKGSFTAPKFRMGDLSSG